MEEARREGRVRMAQRTQRDKVTTEKPERSGRLTKPSTYPYFLTT